MSFAQSLAAWLADTLSFLPDTLIVILAAMMPILELRGSIPLAAFVFDFPWLPAFLWSVLGNLVVVPVIWLGLPWGEKLVRLSQPGNRLLDWLFARTRVKAGPKVERYEELALLAFVAVPLPGTGAWTGVLVAYLFGLSWRKAWPFLFSGILLAGFAVVLLTYGAKAVF